MNMLKHKKQNMDMYIYNTLRMGKDDIHLFYNNVSRSFISRDYKDKILGFLL